MESKDYIRVIAVAKACNWSPQAVYKKIKLKQIRAEKFAGFWVIHKDEVKRQMKYKKIRTEYQKGETNGNSKEDRRVEVA